ncbi:MAG: hypothetical protein WAR81_00835, partial [Pseudomonadales bacterium]
MLSNEQFRGNSRYWRDNAVPMRANMVRSLEVVHGIDAIIEFGTGETHAAIQASRCHFVHGLHRSRDRRQAPLCR